MFVGTSYIPSMKAFLEDGKLFGRGATDDKAPVLGWINVIETMQKNNIDIPVNIKVIKLHL